jgi:hypothetical protein
MSFAIGSLVPASSLSCRFCDCPGREFVQHAFPMPYFREPTDSSGLPLCAIHMQELQLAVLDLEAPRRAIANASPQSVQEASAAVMAGMAAFRRFLQTSPEGIAWSSQLCLPTGQ